MVAKLNAVKTILKILFIVSLVIISGIQTLVFLGINNSKAQPSDINSILTLVSIILLILALAFHIFFKQFRFVSCTLALASAICITIVGYNFIPLFKQNSLNSDFTENGAMTLFYRNHLSSFLVPVFAFSHYILCRISDKKDKEWREKHLNPEDSVLFGGKDSFKMKSFDD